MAITNNNDAANLLAEIRTNHPKKAAVDAVVAEVLADLESEMLKSPEANGFLALARTTSSDLMRYHHDVSQVLKRRGFKFSIVAMEHGILFNFDSMSKE